MSAIPDELLQVANIPDDWDLVIVGDGSGSKYGYPGGWAAILFDRASSGRKLLLGSLNDTTVNVCELSPYLYSMLWYSRSAGKALQQAVKAQTSIGVAPRLVRVHIVTDCDIIARQGRREAERDANLPLWWAMDAFERLGYELNWHWIERDTCIANRLCDHMSKTCRKTMAGIILADPYDDEWSAKKMPEELTVQ